MNPHFFTSDKNRKYKSENEGNNNFINDIKKNELIESNDNELVRKSLKVRPANVSLGSSGASSNPYSNNNPYNNNKEKDNSGNKDSSGANIDNILAKHGIK